MSTIPPLRSGIFRLAALCAAALVLYACRDAGTPDPEPSRPFRILLVSDPFARAMDQATPRIRELAGEEIQLELVAYDDMRKMALQNRRDEVSEYDLISFDVVWLGEFVARRVLEPLQSEAYPPPEAFLPGSLAACRAGERLYGLPVQPHCELLWIRRDLLKRPGGPFPETTPELLDLARSLHDPANGVHGIAWNAQRGQPLGQTMAHLFGAFGQPLLDSDGRPDFDTPEGLAAARYAEALLAVSPPDIHNMAWDQRTSRFASGGAAMTYGWGARTYLVEANPASRVKGDVVYGPPPHAPGQAAVAPLGVWALGIPANAADPERSARVLGRLLEEEVQREIALRGNGAPPLMSLIRDPELQKLYPALRTMSDPGLQARLGTGMRPPVPEWERLCDILGTEFHEMLLGEMTAETALRRAQLRASALYATEAGSIP